MPQGIISFPERTGGTRVATIHVADTNYKCVEAEVLERSHEDCGKKGDIYVMTAHELCKFVQCLPLETRVEIRQLLQKRVSDQKYDSPERSLEFRFRHLPHPHVCLVQNSEVTLEYDAQNVVALITLFPVRTQIVLVTFLLEPMFQQEMNWYARLVHSVLTDTDAFPTAA